MFSTWKLTAIVLAAGVVLSGLGYIVHQAQQSGKDAERLKIEEQNNEALNRANLNSLDRRDCNRLRDGGERVQWDFVSSECVRVVADPQP